MLWLWDFTRRLIYIVLQAALWYNLWYLMDARFKETKEVCGLILLTCCWFSRTLHMPGTNNRSKSVGFLFCPELWSWPDWWATRCPIIFKVIYSKASMYIYIYPYNHTFIYIYIYMYLCYVCYLCYLSYSYTYIYIYATYIHSIYIYIYAMYATFAIYAIYIYIYIYIYIFYIFYIFYIYI